MSKVYSSTEDLENDDYKKIEFDKNLFQKIGTNIVQPGHFAILKKGGLNHLYKRIEVDSKQIWGLESKYVLDNILETQKDFCNQQSKNLSEIDSAFYDSELNCLTIDGKKCQNKEITLLVVLAFLLALPGLSVNELSYPYLEACFKYT